MNSRQKREAQALSRRDFVKASAAGLATITLGPERVFAGGSDKIRLGLIGCGGQ